MNPRVFVTSLLVTGDLWTASGVSGDPIQAGDTLCNAAATDAGLGGRWMALIGGASNQPFARLEGATPYTLVGTTTTVFRTASKLQAPPEVPISRNEHGVLVPNSMVWSGVDFVGTADGVDCNDWQSATMTRLGSVGWSGDAGHWLGAQNVACSNQARLYCFEY